MLKYVLITPYPISALRINWAIIMCFFPLEWLFIWFIISSSLTPAQGYWTLLYIEFYFIYLYQDANNRKKKTNKERGRVKIVGVEPTNIYKIYIFSFILVLFWLGIFFFYLPTWIIRSKFKLIYLIPC